MISFALSHLSRLLACCLYLVFKAGGIRKKCTVFTGNLAFGGRGPELRRSLHRGGKNATCEKSDSTLFDSTRGFPGEGWGRFTMATWNTRSLTFERLQYCKSLDYDVLAITELWRRQHLYQCKSTQFTTSSPIIHTKGPNKSKK